jgi:hypothetical protein
MELLHLKNVNYLYTIESIAPVRIPLMLSKLMSQWLLEWLHADQIKRSQYSAPLPHHTQDNHGDNISGIRTRAIEIANVFEMEFRWEKGMAHRMGDYYWKSLWFEKLYNHSSIFLENNMSCHWEKRSHKHIIPSANSVKCVDDWLPLESIWKLAKVYNLYITVTTIFLTFTWIYPGLDY